MKKISASQKLSTKIKLATEKLKEMRNKLKDLKLQEKPPVKKTKTTVPAKTPKIKRGRPNKK